MPRTCTICVHPERAAIDRALVAGEPARVLASRYGTIGRMALQRHAENHLPETLAKAHEAAEAVRADDLLAEVRALQQRTLGILDKAERADDWPNALRAIREARGNLELLGKLAGELSDAPTVNLVLSPEWQQVRAMILVALAPYPAARLAVAERLQTLEAGANGHAGG